MTFVIVGSDIMLILWIFKNALKRFLTIIIINIFIRTLMQVASLRIDWKK